MKKIYLALVMATALAFIPMQAAAVGHYMETLGEAILREDGLLQVTGIGLTENAFDEVLLYFDEADVYDLQTGFAIRPEDIREGDYIRVGYCPASVAYEIFVHAGEPGSADFMVMVSDNIWYNDDSCAFVTMDGKYRITLTEETMLLDEYGNSLSYDEISPGLEMFVWASFVTASFPGLVMPDKIVLR